MDEFYCAPSSPIVLVVVLALDFLAGLWQTGCAACFVRGYFPNAPCFDRQRSWIANEGRRRGREPGRAIGVFVRLEANVQASATPSSPIVLVVVLALDFLAGLWQTGCAACFVRGYFPNAPCFDRQRSWIANEGRRRGREPGRAIGVFVRLEANVQASATPSSPIVLVVVLALDFVAGLWQTGCAASFVRGYFPNAPCFDRQRSWIANEGRRRGRERLGRAIGVFVSIKAIDQSGQHCYDAREHFLTMANTIGRNETLGDRCIEAGGALECRAAGVIEKPGALATLTFTVSFGRIQKYGEARAIKLFNQLASVLGRRLVDIVQIFGDPGNESEFNAIDI